MEYLSRVCDGSARGMAAAAEMVAAAAARRGGGKQSAQQAARAPSAQPAIVPSPHTQLPRRQGRSGRLECGEARKQGGPIRPFHLDTKHRRLCTVQAIGGGLCVPLPPPLGQRLLCP